jgi:glucokinase
VVELVVADIGGTHARFALAEVAGGRVRRLGEPSTYRTAEHRGLAEAWAEFGKAVGRRPRAASLAIAAAISGDILKLTNNPWTLRPAALRGELGLEQLVLVNDFGAVAHAVTQLGDDRFLSICGPQEPLPREGVLSVLGPGTGLGVALIHRGEGADMIIETEGGHVDFAPLDDIDHALLSRLRDRHGRVSAERVACGPGLRAIYETLAALEGRKVDPPDDRALWELALGRGDVLASAALDRFCRGLGAIAGDMALAHGARAVVIAGGLGQRLAGALAGPAFAEGFTAKGRFSARMRTLPVKLVTHPQPGLLGAAAAFAASLA